MGIENNHSDINLVCNSKLKPFQGTGVIVDFTRGVRAADKKFSGSTEKGTTATTTSAGAIGFNNAAPGHLVGGPLWNCWCAACDTNFARHFETSFSFCLIVAGLHLFP